MNGNGGLTMRYGLIVLLVLALSGLAAPAAAQVSIDIGLPSVNIGINIPVFPELVVVPDYPVYYAPRMNVNYFFFDGMYWVYQDDYWYASYWYNGPWAIVAPEIVPVYILRVPVRYYRHPPTYFAGWRADAPPRWGEHWGRDWEQRRSGWDRWSRGSAPAPAPLPVYQRQYAGDRYPRGEQQQALHNQNYRYQPQDPVVRQHYQQHVMQGSAAPPAQRSQQQGEPQQKNPKQQANQRATPPAPPQEREAVQQKPAPAPAPPAQHPQQGEPQVQGRRQQPPTAQREQPAPAPAPQVQEKAAPHAQPAPAQEEPKQERRQERRQEGEQGQEKGQGHNK